MTTPAIREVGRRFRAARLASGLSQEAVADELGVGHVAVSYWERGARRIPIDKFLDGAALFGVPPASLLPDGGGVGPTSLPEQVRAIRMILDDIETHGGAA